MIKHWLAIVIITIIVLVVNAYPYQDLCSYPHGCDTVAALISQTPVLHSHNTSSRLDMETMIYSLQTRVYSRENNVSQWHHVTENIRIHNIRGDICDHGNDNCQMHISYNSEYPFVKVMSYGDISYDGYYLTIGPHFRFVLMAHNTTVFIVLIDVCMSTPPTKSYCALASERNDGHEHLLFDLKN